MKKRLLALVLTLCLALALLPGVALAYTTGDDYPYAGESGTDDWNFSKSNCTSFVAWCLNTRNGINFTNQYMGVSKWGDAGDWGGIAKSLGFVVDNEPAIGAIAWWSRSDTRSGYGHVAWVKERNENDKRVTIEEYNWNNYHAYEERTISQSSPTGYIHIADIEKPLDGDDFTNSSWFGQYTGYTDGGSILLERYIDFTIDECDDEGNFSGSAKVTTVEGQGYDYQWVNYEMAGKINFETKAFQMQGTNITSYNSGSNWSLALFKGTFEVSKNGDMTFSGLVDNVDTRHFSFARTSAWARDEMTEANILGLIPDTLKGVDMSKKIDRAEFTAVAVKLYESLMGTQAVSAAAPFADIRGNANEENIKKAYALGLVTGISDSEFAPEQTVTREQMATMLCRVIKKYSFKDWTFATDSKYYLDTSGVAVFADDADISAFAKPSVYYMVKMGIIKGIDETHFAPKSVTTEQEAAGYATATREQAVALSLRVYKMSDVWG